MAHYAGKTIPATKTGGGVSVYGAGSAVFEWCQWEWQGDDIVFLDDDSTEKDDAQTERLRQEAETFTDMSESILQSLLDAEQAATPEDFAGTEFDMGVPAGYIKKLHQLGKTQL